MCGQSATVATEAGRRQGKETDMNHGQPEPPKPHLARKIPRKAEKLLADGTARIAAVEARPDLYPNPNPPLAQAKDNLKKLSDCITAAKGAGKVARSAVRDAAGLVTSDQNLLAAYVQSLADGASPEHAALLIATALFDLRKPPARGPKPEIAAKHGPTSGTAKLEAAAIARALVYFWEMSADGKSWNKAVDTEKVTAIVTGLTPGQTYYFRFRAFVRKGGYMDYSQVVSLLVV
jgi:hypothetical protein